LCLVTRLPFVCSEAVGELGFGETCGRKMPAETPALL
jgi:hypothetical protein